MTTARFWLNVGRKAARFQSEFFKACCLYDLTPPLRGEVWYTSALWGRHDEHQIPIVWAQTSRKRVVLHLFIFTALETSVPTVIMNLLHSVHNVYHSRKIKSDMYSPISTLKNPTFLSCPQQIIVEAGLAVGTW